MLGAFKQTTSGWPEAFINRFGSPYLDTNTKTKKISLMILGCLWGSARGQPSTIQPEECFKNNFVKDLAPVIVTGSLLRYTYGYLDETDPKKKNINVIIIKFFAISLFFHVLNKKIPCRAFEFHLKLTKLKVVIALLDKFVTNKHLTLETSYEKFEGFLEDIFLNEGIYSDNKEKRTSLIKLYFSLMLDVFFGIFNSVILLPPDVWFVILNFLVRLEHYTPLDSQVLVDFQKELNRLAEEAAKAAAAAEAMP